MKDSFSPDQRQIRSKQIPQVDADEMLESIKSGISESDQVDRRLFEAAENSGLDSVQVGLK